LALLEPTLVLLHHLVFPAPFTKPPLPFPRATALAQDSQSVNQAILGPGPDPEPDSDAISQGLNLPGRLHAAAQTKEFNGVHHVFQAALGPMAFADVDLEDEMAQWSVLGEKKNVALMDLRTIQCEHHFRDYTGDNAASAAARMCPLISIHANMLV
jgi:hypothetical protein